ncbi:MAG TPA: hypothetical protein VFO57_08945, partial [Burkholderiales bacterium]|nr:hypothetical protein [Burkholderiales bacterium]
AIGFWMGSSVSFGAFIMREYTLREIEILRERQPAPDRLSLFDGLTGWKRDRFLDAAAPAVACTLLALAASL